MNGTTTFAGATYAWTLVDAADPLRALVTYELDGFACGYGTGRLDGEAFTPWCGCEHNDGGSARDCRRAKAARAEYVAMQDRARTAALPAPEGATHLKHCGRFWRAAFGGACSACGAAGEAFTPGVGIQNDRAHGWTTLTTEGVEVTTALVEAGLTPADVRLAHGDTAYVTGLRAAELGAALAAKGWSCTVRGVARRKAGAA